MDVENAASSQAANGPDTQPLVNKPSLIRKDSLSRINRWAGDFSSRLRHSITRNRSSTHLGPKEPEIYYTVFQAPWGTPLYDPGKQPWALFEQTTDDHGQVHYHYIPLRSRGPTSATEFHELYQSVIEAIHLNIRPNRISQGSSGSYFVFNTHGRVVAVFKPKDEEPYGPISPKWTKWIHRTLFPCFFGRSCLIPNLGYISEAAASVLDRQLMTYIVPYTDIVSLSSSSFYYRYWDRYISRKKGRPLPSKIGSFQLFLHDYRDATSFFRLHPWPEEPRYTDYSQNSNNNNNHFHTRLDRLKASQDLFWTPALQRQFRIELEKLVILDYLMRNTDRGSDNWMIKVEWDHSADDPNKLTPRIRIGAIDSGLSFPWKHPDEWRSYPFGWLFLPTSLIGQPFSDASRKHFLPLLCSPTWWKETTKLLRDCFSQDADFKERMWKKQLALIKGQAFNIVESLKDPSQGPLELARRSRVMVWDDTVQIPIPEMNPTLPSNFEVHENYIAEEGDEDADDDEYHNKSQQQPNGGNVSLPIKLPSTPQVTEPNNEEEEDDNDNTDRGHSSVPRSPERPVQDVNNNFSASNTSISRSAPVPDTTPVSFPAITSPPKTTPASIYTSPALGSSISGFANMPNRDSDVTSLSRLPRGEEEDQQRKSRSSSADQSQRRDRSVSLNTLEGSAADRLTDYATYQPPNRHNYHPADRHQQPHLVLSSSTPREEFPGASPIPSRHRSKSLQVMRTTRPRSSTSRSQVQHQQPLDGSNTGYDTAEELSGGQFYKQVIVERLENVRQTPVFTWC